MEKRPLTLAEVRDLVFQRWSRDQSALIPDQRKLFEYLAKFTKVRDPKAARKAVEVLMSEYNLSEEDAIQLVNVLPRTPDELRPFLFRSYPLLDERAYQGILEVLKGLEEAEVTAKAGVEAGEAVGAQSEEAARVEGGVAQDSG